jgi:MFS family permease
MAPSGDRPEYGCNAIGSTLEFMPENPTQRTSFAVIMRAMQEQTANLRGVVFGLGIAAFAAYQQFKLPVVLPVLLERYGYERTLAGGFVSVYAVAGLLLSVWLGRRVERIGPFKPVLIGLGIIIMGSLLAIAQPESGLIVLAGRALEGVGFAALAICGPVLASANASPRQLPLVLGLSAAWIPFGQLSATAAAPLALALGDWQLLWWAGIAGAVCLALVTVRLQHDPHILFSAAPSQPTTPTCSAREQDPNSQAQRPTTHAILSAHERNSLIVVACIFSLWSSQYFAFMTWLPQYLVEVHDLAVGDALLGYVVPIVAVIAFAVIAGALLRAGLRLGPLLITALISQAAVWWLLPFAGGGWGGVLALVVYGIGAGIVPTCLFASPNAVLGAGRSPAAAFGVIMTGRNLGVLTGPVLLAWVAGSERAWNQGALLFAVLTSIALTLALLLSRRLSSPLRSP